MNTDKLFIIFMIVMVILSFGGMGLSNYSEDKANIEISKQGLEQCPSNGPNNRGKIIWVKDCNSYLNNLNK